MQASVAAPGLALPPSPRAAPPEGPPINTFAEPTLTSPLGGWRVLLDTRAAGWPLTTTVAAPVMMKFGEGAAQNKLSPPRACGSWFVMTFGEHGGATGPPPWGLGAVHGQIWASPILVAPLIGKSPLSC
jgi:hypothetical protein